MTKHFLEIEVTPIANVPITNAYGSVMLLKGKEEYYIGIPHWREGYIVEEVSKDFAKAFIKEFENGD